MKTGQEKELPALLISNRPAPSRSRGVITWSLLLAFGVPMPTRLVLVVSLTTVPSSVQPAASGGPCPPASLGEPGDGVFSCSGSTFAVASAGRAASSCKGSLSVARLALSTKPIGMPIRLQRPCCARIAYGVGVSRCARRQHRVVLGTHQQVAPQFPASFLCLHRWGLPKSSCTLKKPLARLTR